MSVSTLFESYIMYYSDMAITKAAMLYFVEWIAVVVAYLWLMYRFTKRYSLRNFDSSVGFDFSQGFGFIVTLSLLVAIIVGMSTTIFYSVMGFDGFVDGYLMRMDELVAYMGEHNMAMEPISEDVAKMRDDIEALQQPSMLSSILGAINSYVFAGIIVGLIMAATLRRKPVIENRERDEE